MESILDQACCKLCVHRVKLLNIVTEKTEMFCGKSDLQTNMAGVVIELDEPLRSVLKRARLPFLLQLIEQGQKQKICYQSEISDEVRQSYINDLPGESITNQPPHPLWGLNSSTQ